MREIATTFYLNVPRGFEWLVALSARREEIARNILQPFQLMYYAGAGLSQPVWDELDALSIETSGERVLMLTGLGSTETAPFALVAAEEGGALPAWSASPRLDAN